MAQMRADTAARSGTQPEQQCSTDTDPAAVQIEQEATCPASTASLTTASANRQVLCLLKVRPLHGCNC